MSVDLTMLVWAITLTVVQMLVAVNGALFTVGLSVLAGNREGMGDCPGWVGRAQRAHRNMLENLPLFAAAVLVTAAAGKANDMTALGAQIFFYARLVYVPIYLLGVHWLRTAAWTASMVGLGVILTQLF
ncbi:MAG: MAPEG family protein [Silvibacterium sp.]|nr:MAPEG family protein [Silvibacterium sp.]